MQQVDLNELLEAGVHFGHQTRRWNPKMRKYIFTERNGIHIIDLRMTLDRLVTAQKAIRELVMKGDKVLFVCTKRQLRGVIEQEAKRCGAFYVTERWLGGMLTNFQTIRKQIRRLKELERGHEENAFEFYTKKERLLIERERTRLDRYLQGVKDMARVPGAMFVVDAKRETIAVREAHRLNIPVFAITDTNADPDLIDYPIPGNDDAIRSVGLIAKALADSIEVAQREIPEEDRRRVEDLEATTYSTETGEKTAEAVEQPARRPKRKRRPVPDAIAKVRRPSGEESAEVEEAASASEPEAVSDEASGTDSEEAPEAEVTSEPEAMGEEVVAESEAVAESGAVAESEAVAETKDESPTEEAPEAEPGADGEKETSSES